MDKYEYIVYQYSLHRAILEGLDVQHERTKLAYFYCLLFFVPAFQLIGNREVEKKGDNWMTTTQPALCKWTPMNISILSLNKSKSNISRFHMWDCAESWKDRILWISIAREQLYSRKPTIQNLKLYHSRIPHNLKSDIDLLRLWLRWNFFTVLLLSDPIRMRLNKRGEVWYKFILVSRDDNYCISSTKLSIK